MEKRFALQLPPGSAPPAGKKGDIIKKGPGQERCPGGFFPLLPLSEGKEDSCYQKHNNPHRNVGEIVC